MIGATGGSGTRVLAAIVQRAGMFVGSDLNRSLDALDFAAFFDRWVGRELTPGAAAELRALVARQTWSRRAALGLEGAASVYLLPSRRRAARPALPARRPRRPRHGLLRQPGAAPQARRRGARPGDEPEALRSIALWREINLRAADFGERELGDRYLRIRFEDLCASQRPVAEVLRFLGLDGDARAVAAEEVRAPPTLGRWREADPRVAGGTDERAGDALVRLGYQSSSE